GTTERLNGGQGCVTSSSGNAGFRIASTRPGLSGSTSPSCFSIDARRRSMSTRRTRASGAWASAPARLIAVVVFPSPTVGLVTARTVSSALLWNCSTRCRSARYCSAAKDVGVRRLTRCSSTPSVACGTSQTLVISGPGLSQRRGELLVASRDEVRGAHEDRHTQHGCTGGKPEPPPAPSGIRFRHDAGDAREDRGRTEPPELVHGVEGGVELLGQHHCAGGEPKREHQADQHETASSSHGLSGGDGGIEEPELLALLALLHALRDLGLVIALQQR